MFNFIVVSMQLCILRYNPAIQYSQIQLNASISRTSEKICALNKSKVVDFPVF